MGMTEEVQAHLFEPFFTTKETGKGTGLGLAQVFGIVRQHEGHIDVETAPNEGTTFRIYLPIRDIDVETAPPNPRTRVPKGRGETVLLVEDEVGVRDAIQQVLTSLKYEVITASDGDEALSVCRSPARAVDMVVTDLVMPEMGGRQLLRELQSIRPDLPVMAITGYALEGDDLNALLDAGFVDVIFKPLDIERLVQSVRHVFDA
jgi:CheY-like chemotaxis protein